MSLCKAPATLWCFIPPYLRGFLAATSTILPSRLLKVFSFSYSELQPPIHRTMNEIAVSIVVLIASFIPILAAIILVRLFCWTLQFCGLLPPTCCYELSRSAVNLTALLKNTYFKGIPSYLFLPLVKDNYSRRVYLLNISHSYMFPWTARLTSDSATVLGRPELAPEELGRGKRQSVSGHGHGRGRRYGRDG